MYNNSPVILNINSGDQSSNIDKYRDFIASKIKTEGELAFTTLQKSSTTRSAFIRETTVTFDELINAILYRTLGFSNGFNASKARESLYDHKFTICGWLKHEYKLKQLKRFKEIYAPHKPISINSAILVGDAGSSFEVRHIFKLKGTLTTISYFVYVVRLHHYWSPSNSKTNKQLNTNGTFFENFFISLYKKGFMDSYAHSLVKISALNKLPPVITRQITINDSCSADNTSSLRVYVCTKYYHLVSYCYFVNRST